MKKNRYVLTITLNPAIDKTIVVPHFQQGRIFRPDAISLSAGGKGINVSRVLSQLGVNTLASGFLPQKGAEFIRPELFHNHIKHHFVKIDGDVRTNLTILNPVSKRATRIFEPGGVVKRKDVRRFKEIYVKLLQKARIVVISGSNALGVPPILNGQLVSLAKRAGVMTVLDTSLDPFKWGIKRKPFMIKPNLQEAEAILNRRLRNRKQIIRALKDLHHQGAHTVALTDGNRGAYVYNGKQMLKSTTPRVKQKNPVGCGDSFVAGFLWAYLKNKSFADCIRYGSACGCVNAVTVNPGSVSLSQVVRVVKKVTITSLQ